MSDSRASENTPSTHPQRPALSASQTATGGVAASTRIDWIGLLGRVQRKNFHYPYAWTKLARNQQVRIPDWKIREKMRVSRRGIEIQICHRLSEDHRHGDMQPVDIVKNEFDGNRNSLKSGRQKIKSGEKVLWDTWVRIKPPATLTAAQAREQAEYDKNLAGVVRQDALPHDAPLTDDEKRRLDIENMHGLDRLRAERRWEQEKIQEGIDYRAALRQNRLYGDVGLKQWRTARALERIKESREKYARIATLNRKEEKK